MDKIIVIGSSNIDLIASVSSLPKPGETIGNGRFSQANGGKGANQAVAAARLGGDVLFVTCVGEDMNGRMLEKQFASDGIHTSHMKFEKEAPTGTALIFVADDGENCIAVAPGANNCLLPSDIEKVAEEIRKAEYVLLQQEIPVETVEKAVEIASAGGVKVVLNPAPMRPVADSVLSDLFLITPNETEAEKLTGVRIETAGDAEKAAAILLDKGVKNVIVTLGSNGSVLCNTEGTVSVPARKVKAVDTTAAGDVYNGALVAALSEGCTITEAMRFATVSSSISVTRAGAQPSVPFRTEVDEMMNNL